MPDFASNAMTIYSTDEQLLTEVRTALEGVVAGRHLATEDDPAEGQVSWPVPHVFAQRHQALDFVQVSVPVKTHDGPMAGIEAATEAWGTKWNASLVKLVQDEHTLTYTFHCPWGPSMPVTQDIAKRWPALVIQHSWTTEGMDACGTSWFANGHRFSELHTNGDDIVLLNRWPAGATETEVDSWWDEQDPEYQLPEWHAFSPALAAELAPTTQHVTV